MKKLEWKAITLLVLMVLLVGLFTLAFNIQPVAAVDWWPTFQHDIRRTGYSTSTAPDTVSVLWSDTLYGHQYYGSPTVINDKLYITTSDSLYCLDATTGENVWTFCPGGLSLSFHTTNPSVAYGNVYVQCVGDSGLYCLDALNGDYIWHYSSGPGGLGVCPAVIDAKVYIQSVRSLECVDAYTGDFIWEYDPEDTLLGAGGTSSPAVANNRVYAGQTTASGHGPYYWQVYCVNALTGTSIWTYEAGASVRSSPALAYGNVYIGADNANVYCLPQYDPNGDGVIDSSEVVWIYKTGDAVRSSPAVAYGMVYVGSNDGELYCLNASTGAKIWSYPKGGVASPAVADGKVYVGSYDGNLYCLDATTGAYISSYPIGDWSYSPAVTDSKIYVAGGAPGYLSIYAFELPNHNLTITKTTGGTTDPTPGTHTYPYDSTVVITAIPNQCFLFDHWELDGEDVGSVNPYSVLMHNDHTLHAVFVRINYDLTITTTTGGVTDPAPGTHNYACSSYAEVTAIPNICYLFDHWELDGFNVGSDNPYSVHIDDVHTLHAVFQRVSSFSLTITPTAGGTTNPPAGTYTYACSSFVDVTATPDECYLLDHWELDGLNAGSDNPYSILMDDNYTLHAIFVVDIHDVAVTNLTPSDSLVGQGDPTSINATVENHGDNAETFNLTLYFDSSIIQTKTVTNLPSAQQTNVIFTWNTAGIAPGGYTIAAHAHIILCETDTTDNTFEDGIVRIVACGDCNADGNVVIADVVYLVNYLFRNGPVPVPEACVGDANGDGNTTISDAVYLVNYLFKDGDALVGDCCAS